MIIWTEVKDKMPEPLKEGELFDFLGRKFRARLIIMLGSIKPLNKEQLKWIDHKKSNPVSLPTLYAGYSDGERFYESNGREIIEVTKWCEINT